VRVNNNNRAFFAELLFLLQYTVALLLLEESEIYRKKLEGTNFPCIALKNNNLQNPFPSFKVHNPFV